MVIASTLLLAAAAAWLGFMAVDRIGLKTREGTAHVANKNYVKARTTYNATAHGMPHRTPGTYLLVLDMGGQTAYFAAEKEVYDVLEAGQQVKVGYQHARFSGALRIARVDAPGGLEIHE